MAPARKVIGAHELGTYVYCPRAWWYDHHPGSLPGGPPREEYSAGLAFHEAAMRAHVRHQEGSGAPYGAIAAVGILLLGVMVWWFHGLPFFSWPW